MNLTAKFMHRALMQIARRRRWKGSKKEVRSTTPSFLLPRDVLATILIRLPGSDLRRLRRVCKEWRDIISDPAFIQEHMVYEPKWPLTHTIVFFSGFAYGSLKDPHNGRGFLFDQYWRLEAELTAGRWDSLIGSCNGLLCFLECGQGSIKIIEPFTGESLVVPQPPEASGLRWTVNSGAYCFGFDATARQYKIVHHNFLKYSAPLEGESVEDEELHVYTVGGGKGWTRVHVAHSVHGQAYGDPLYIDRVVYWPSRTYVNLKRHEKLVRFDPATEKITSEASMRLRLDPPRPEKTLFCRLVHSTSCVMTYGRYCEWDAWFPEAEEGGVAASLPGGRVLLNDWFDHGLYLRMMNTSLQFGQRELLFEVCKKQTISYKNNGRTSFVPARRCKQLPISGAGQATTIGYAPTVSYAPLALYLGTPNP